MGFEHKIVSEDPAPQFEGEELQLSEDQRVLAGRLEAESRTLANRYPAGERCQTSGLGAALPADAVISDTPRRTAVALAGISLACLLTFGGGWVAALLVNRPAVAESDADDGADRSANGQRAMFGESAVAAAPEAKSSPDHDQVGGVGSAVYAPRSAPPEVREVLANQDEALDEDFATSAMSDVEKIALLEDALERYRSVIVYLKERLSEREQQQMSNQQRIDSLQAELQSLRRKLDAAER